MAGEGVAVEPGSAVPAPAGSPTGSAAPSGQPITDWRTSLPEDIRGEKVWDSIKGKDVAEVFPIVAKNYVNGQKLIGKSIQVPGEKATPQEIAAYREKTGVPASPDKYDLTLGEEVAGYMDPGLIDGFRSTAHKLGVPQTAAKALLEWYAGNVANQVATQFGETKETVAGLKTAWGGAFDRNMTMAKRACIELGGQELLDTMDRTGLGNSAVIIKMFAKMGAIMAEDGIVPSEVEGVTGADEAMKKIAAVNADRKHPYFDKYSPGHEEAVKEMTNLFQIAYPNL